MITEKQFRMFERTLGHIHRVQRNALALIKDFDEVDLETKRLLMTNVLVHDRTKFSITQFEPYIELTESYHQKRVLGNMGYKYDNSHARLQVDNAIQNHYLSENHHPDRWPNQVELAKSGNHFERSKATLMEVVCDLQAMEQEITGDRASCWHYFQTKWLPKHNEKLIQSDVDFMLRVIEFFEQRARYNWVTKPGDLNEI